MQVEINSNKVFLLPVFFFFLGSDAEKSVWCTIDRNLELYACHKEIIETVVNRLDAYW